MSAINSNDQVSDFDEIGEALLFLWSEKVKISYVATAIFLFSLFIILIQSPHYKATASVVLQRHELNLPDFFEVAAIDKFSAFSAQTETKILTSTELAHNTIKATNYAEKIGAESIESSMGKFSQSLSVVSQPSSKVIDISFEAKDPQLAADVANSLVHEYLVMQNNNKNLELSKLKEWFHGKVDALKNDVISKSRKVEDYRIKEGISLEDISNNLNPQSVKDLSDKLSLLNSKKIELEAKINTIQSAKASGSLDKIPTTIIPIESAPEISQLREQEIKISQDLASLVPTYGSKHPKVVQVSGNLAQIKNLILRQIGGLEESFSSERDTVDEEIKSTKAHMQSIQKEGDYQQEKLIRLKTLIYDRDASQKQLDNFLASYENIQSQVNFPQPDASLVSSAVVPSSPDTPPKKILIFLSLLFSLGAGCAYAILMQIINPRVSSYSDLRKFSLRPLGIIGSLGDVNYGDTQCFQNFINKIYISSIADSSCKTLLITSAKPKDGRTTLVLNLATYLISIGKRVLVIDADVAKPKLTEICMAGETPQNIYQDDSRICKLSGIDIIPSTTILGHYKSGFSIEFFDQNIEKFKNLYDIVLIDAGPILSNGEPQALCRRVDGVIAIINWAQTTKRDLKNMVSILKMSQSRVLGCVFNRVDLEMHKSSRSRHDFVIARDTHM